MHTLLEHTGLTALHPHKRSEQLIECQQESYFTYSAQEESPVNHDVHFRPGIGADGSDTFTPRTLIYDFKQSYGALRKYNELYDAPGNADETGDIWCVLLISRSARG